MNTPIWSRTCCAVLLFCSLPSNIFAQTMTGDVTGRVVTSAATPVAEVVIQIDTQNTRHYSDKDGKFFIEKVEIGSHQFFFRHIGFESKCLKNSLIREGSVNNLGDIELIARLIPLAGMNIVSARIDKHPFELAMPFNLMASEEIKVREAKTSAEALREEPGLVVQKTNHGGGSAIIRGLSSNQILILVDGIRLNNSTYRLGNHQYLTTVDQNMLSQMEVVRGPNSVLYGSDICSTV